VDARKGLGFDETARASARSSWCVSRTRSSPERRRVGGRKDCQRARAEAPRDPCAQPGRCAFSSRLPRALETRCQMLAYCAQRKFSTDAVAFSRMASPVDEIVGCTNPRPCYAGISQSLQRRHALKRSWSDSTALAQSARLCLDGTYRRHHWKLRHPRPFDIQRMWRATGAADRPIDLLPFVNAAISRQATDLTMRAEHTNDQHHTQARSRSVQGERLTHRGD
jgi:hypothetical protein